MIATSAALGGSVFGVSLVGGSPAHGAVADRSSPITSYSAPTTSSQALGTSTSAAGPAASPPSTIASTTTTQPAADPSPAAGSNASLPASTASTTVALPVAAVTAPPVLVATTTVTLVDGSRSTPERGDVGGFAGRVLRTVILRPLTPGLHPVVVFAHGFDSTPETYARLLDAWAGAGYLVVAPASPGSAAGLPGEPTRSDIGAQASDLSFVLSAVLADPMLGADPRRVAVAGHSDGASAVVALMLDEAYRDPRIDAFMVLSGAVPALGGIWDTGRAGTSALIAVGDADEYGNFGGASSIYSMVATQKTELIAYGGDHLGTYVAASTLAVAMRNATVGFLNSFFATGRSSLQVDGARFGVRSQG